MLLLTAGQTLQAEELNLNQLQQQIDNFKQGESYRYARQTIQRANAYLGAAMLAQEQEKTADAQRALGQAAVKLAEARQTAAAFTRQFADLILLRQQALNTVKIISLSSQSANALAASQTSALAQREFDQAISSHELGQLNQTEAHRVKARQYFQQIIADTLPRLTELTARAIGKAANTGAKQYAPQTYQAAKDKLAELRAFHDGLGDMPAHPEEALYLAREAKHMAEQVKLWRKKTRSHEEITLKQRRLKLQLAEALHIQLASKNPMLMDVRSNDLSQAIEQARQTLLDERKKHRQDIARLKKQYEQQLQDQLAAQTNSMNQAQRERLSSIKDAFRAKLERSQAQLEKETFDSKRQQKLHQLFKKGEVQILINLDGSLLIRLSSLKFAPGKSKIEPGYFDMLGRLHQAMAIYSDRKLRIEGHTDNLGDIKPNQVLSLKRAEAVRDFLISAGADGSRLKALGYGEVRPIASNDFPKGRAMNRRIDIVITAPQ